MRSATGNNYTVEYVVSSGDEDVLDSQDLQVSVIVKDQAGNESAVYSLSDPPGRPGVDAHAPEIGTVTFAPSIGMLKIGDTATATITAVGGETGLVSGTTMTINGLNVAGTFFELGGGSYRVTYTVESGDSDRLDSEDLPINLVLRDIAGNESPASTTSDISGRPGVDAHAPEIGTVTFAPSIGMLKIGDTATATITAVGGETGLVSGTTMTINGLNVAGTFFELGGGSYRVTYTVESGDSDRLDSEDLPINLVLRDIAGNESPASTTSDISGRPGVDAHAPGIGSVIFSPSSGMLKIGDTATATITAVGGETGLVSGTTMTINGLNVAGTFFELGGGSYRVTYTVESGDSDRLDSEDLPINLVLRDIAGNESPASTTSDIANRPGVDAHAPTISDVTFNPASGLLKIGDTATATIISDGTGYIAGTITINGKDVSGTLSSAGGNNYTVAYTVQSGDTDISDASDLPVDIVLIDAIGNQSSAYTVSDPGGRPGVDAHIPVITNVTFNPSFGLLRIGATATATIISDGTGYIAGTITINGKDVSGTLAPAGGNSYTVTYTVASGDTDISDASDLPIDFTLIDAAGNPSSAYAPADAAGRPGVDAHTPTAPGDLAFFRKTNTSIMLTFGATTTESDFKEYRIYYKIGSSGVSENDSLFGSSTDPNLGSISYNNATSTIITGLATSTQYVFNIWAYDWSGNKVSATEITSSTNHPPMNPSNLGQYKSDGSTSILNGGWTNEGTVKLAAGTTDSDAGEMITLYYQLASTSGSMLTATTVPAGACALGYEYPDCASKIWAATSTFGDYSSEPFTATSAINGLPDYGAGYKWQVLACDLDSLCSNWTDAGADPNFKVDHTPPTVPGQLALNYKWSTYLILDFGATTTEANFDRYKIFYKLGSDGVLESDNEHSDPDLLFADLNGSSTTTIINLSASTTYSINIWAYDLAGNKASATFAVIATEEAMTPPTGIFNSVTQKTDGSGFADISIEADDEDNNDSLRAKLEYVLGSACDFGSPNLATIAEDDGQTTADYGDPKADNSSNYQVGTTTGWILTSPGANTVNFDWDTKSDIPGADGEVYCLRLTVNDSRFNQDIPATSTVIIDNTSLSAPGNLVHFATSTYALTLSFGGQSTGNNFDRYRIFYKTGSSGVTEYDAEYNNSNLAEIDYAGAATATVSGLLPATQYFFNIWTYDDYGNRASATAELSAKTNAIPGTPAALYQRKNDGSTVVVNGGWTNENGIKLYASAADADTSEMISLYFEMIPIGQSHTTATSVPSSACTPAENYDSCASKIWEIVSDEDNHSITPFSGMVNPGSVASSSIGYKWQVMACDDLGACSQWADFGADPNFKVDYTPPSVPGDLTLAFRNASSITLNFGAQSQEANFKEYIIYYKTAASGVTEADIKHGSTTDPNLLSISYGGKPTTTISGLSEGTQYVFNVWAYDLAGNKASASAEYSTTLNNRPTSSFISILQKSDGSGAVDISIRAGDGDQENLKTRIDYVSGGPCNFSTPLDPYLDGTDSSATSTYGDAKIDNSSIYQVGTTTGWIITSSGQNAVSFDWLSKANVPAANGTYCLRTTASDGTDDQLAGAFTTFTLDNVNPTPPGPPSLESRTADSLTLHYGSAVTETNPREYKIFYKQGVGIVSETDSEHIDADLLNIDYNYTTTTTVSGLLPNTEYSFKVYAYDMYGNKSSSDQVSFTTNAQPIGTFNSVSEKTNGSGDVDISIEAYDANGDLCRAKIEYVAGATCNFAPPLNPALNSDPAKISADFGTPVIDNAQNYQIGSSSGYIITNQGSNTVDFDWQSKLNLSGASGIYCLRLTVNDGTDDQAQPATTTVYIDNKAPEDLGFLTLGYKSGNTVTLAYGDPAVDENFEEYKIFYKAGSSGVTESDSVRNKYDDSSLGISDFGTATSTKITGLLGLTQYVFNIWAYDSYGNKATASPEFVTTTDEIPVASWREAEDTVDPTVSIPLGKETPVRLRLDIANQGDYPAQNYRYRLEYGIKNGTCAAVGSWVPVPASSANQHFRMQSSQYFTNGDSTSARLANPEVYSYVSGYLVSLPANTSSPVALDPDEYTEIEYVFEATRNSLASTTYCFRATDEGREISMYDAYAELTLAPRPTGSFASAVLRADGSGIADISINIGDSIGRNSRARIDYTAGAECDFTASSVPSLDAMDDNITALYGDPDIDNSAYYQIGTGSAMIVTAYGQNTVNFDWNTEADLSSADGVYCMRLNANNGYDDQDNPATTTIVIDHISPTNPGNLTEISKTSNSVTLGFGATSSDSNFKEYRIYYKEGSPGVTESDSLWSSSTDPNLGYADILGASTTKITGLTVNKTYYFKIWAYDWYGNKASSSQEISVAITYGAKSGDWRWYYDEFNETPVSAGAWENIAPANIISGGSIKLRLNVREYEGITGDNVKIRLQYSEFSDFSQDVYFVGEIGSSSALWRYADGVDIDDSILSSTTLISSDLAARHNESGISTSSFDHVGNSIAEWEFTIMNNDAPAGITYYFRAFQSIGNTYIAKDSGKSYPSLVTDSGEMTFSASGVGSGILTEGITTNISTSYSTISLGSLINSESVGAYRFNITTNTSGGYRLYVQEDNNLISNGGSFFNPISADNEAPQVWPSEHNPSNFGYHTGDDTLSGPSPSRFLPDDRYAKLESQMKEVGYSPIPIENDSFDLIYRAAATNMQPAGDYKNQVIYILVPAY